MEQNAAAMLLLAASVCGYAASATTNHNLSTMMGVVAIGVGLWGGLSLMQATAAASDAARQGHAVKRRTTPAAAMGNTTDLPPSNDSVTTTELGLYSTPHGSTAGGEIGGISLTPEVNAQIAVVAHMKGLPRNQIVDEVLRRHLPRFTHEANDNSNQRRA
ncbi:MAG: hypothetical protein R3E01_23080 [Pirellulaceae bacterium]|nr:hypothetical protein [Planctomycetales bacterium]